MSSAAAIDVARQPSHERPTDHASRLLGAAGVFSLGLLGAFQLKLIGTISAAEFALLAVLPFTFVAARELDRRVQLLLLLGAAWLWNQVVTDLVRHSAFVDYSRGWSKIAFALVNLLALWFLVGRRLDRQLLFASGLAAAFALRFALNPSELAQGDPWKFGFAVPVTLGIAIASSTTFARRKWFVQPALLASASVLNMMLGFRSLAGVCFLAAVLLTLRSRRAGGVRLTPTALAVIAAASAVAFFVGYQRAAKDGVLGPAAAVKFENQSRGTGGLFLAGRPEAYASALAIRDSPFIGHGSWPSNPKYRLAMVGELRSRGYLAYEPFETDRIPTHSYLLGAWVEAGILGAVFWAAVLALCVSALLAIHQSHTRFAALGSFLGFWLIWDVLFSPFGTDGRVIVPFAIVVLVSALRDAHARSSQSRASSPAGAGA
jgi:hypothetical protein